MAEQSDRFLASVEVLWEIDFNLESALPGLTVGHVITHVARCADDCADLLYEMQTGFAGPAEPHRRWPEDPGCFRPGAVLIDDIATALRRAGDALSVVPEAEWGDNPAVDRVPWDLLTELVVHDMDLGVALAPLDDELAGAVLEAVVAHLPDDAGWPVLGIRTVESGTVVEISDEGGTISVSGTAEDLLRWLTGRSCRGRLETSSGDSPPRLPGWHCNREFETL